LWDLVHAINLTGTFDCCQAVLPHMIESGWGRIVNISSSSTHGGVAQMAAYVSSKSAVIGLTKVLALEFAKHGITVNTIPPGFIDTP
ncbi:SDR family NAD(P)-dependent oxidoreductase, partial [Priestia sp. SIMBA_032]|uniref:SDR family NAD(P)-dependent oxidoreductase n=1 Tax=Priestia sp. SIMBA_032 TaxID=3085775 RepID=UPI003978D9FE